MVRLVQGRTCSVSIWVWVCSANDNTSSWCIGRSIVYTANSRDVHNEVIEILDRHRLFTAWHLYVVAQRASYASLYIISRVIVMLARVNALVSLGSKRGEEIGYYCKVEF